MREAQHHRAAHRMGERKMRRRTLRQHILLHEGLDVDLVVGEIAHIALARIAQPPRRMALPAPVDHGDREAAIAQVPHRLEIFLDLLAAAGEDADRALAPGRRRPARETQFGAVGGLDGAGDDVFRNRIGGNRDKRHGLKDRLGENGWESRAGKASKRQKGYFSTLLNAVSPFPISLWCRPLPVFRKSRTTSGCARRKPGPMAGGLPQTVAQWRTTYAYFRPHPVLSFHRRLRPPALPARPGDLRRQSRLSALQYRADR